MIDYKITNEYGYKNDYSYLDSLIKRIFKRRTFITDNIRNYIIYTLRKL